MKRFAEMVLKHRLPIILATILLTIFFTYGLTLSTINSDLLSYLNPEAPSIKLFHRLGDEYGGNTTALVAIRSDEIFSTKTLTLIRDLTEAYRNIPGIASVVSLTNILDIKKIEDGIEVGKLIDADRIPVSGDELKQIKEYTLNKDLYAGKIISEDGKTALIICRLRSDVPKDKVGEKIKEITEEMRGTATVYYGGVPLQMIELNGLLIGDMVHLIPVVVLVVIVILFLSFRNIRGVILPLLNVAIASIWSMGLMGWTGVPLSIISNTMPVVLIAIGTAYGIHLLAKYNETSQEFTDSGDAVKYALEKVGLPIFLTGITTLIGFFSFTGAFLTSVTDFGIYAAIGVGVAMMISVTFIPALISFLPLPKIRGIQKKAIMGWRQISAEFGNFIMKRKRGILILSLILFLLAGYFIPGMRTEVSMVNVFPENSDVIRTDKLLRNQFGGGLGIQIVVKGNLKEPAVLKEMLETERFLESLPHVSAAQSLADLICEMNDVMNGRHIVPETSDQVANLLFMLEGEEMLNQLVNKDYTEGIIQANFEYDVTEDFIGVYNSVEQYLKNEFDDSLIVVSLDSLTEKERNKIQRERISEITRDILYDAERRGAASLPDSEKVSGYLVRFSNDSLFKNVQLDSLKFRARIEQYFHEEADIFLETDEEIERVVSAVFSCTEKGTTTLTDLKKILKKTIASSYYQDDPESLDYTAVYLKDIIDEMILRQRITRFSAELLRDIPEFPQNRKFIQDIKSNLWELSGRNVPVPFNKFPDYDYPLLTIKVEQSGIPVVLTRFHHDLIRSQRNSLIIALGIVLILMIFQFRSILMGLIVTTPIIFTVVLNFGFMSFVGAPLDLATMMIASIAIGIGIDYAIHFSSRFRMEVNDGKDEKNALQKTLQTTGKALIINALTVGLGFIILMGSSIVPVQRFGWLIALTMLISVTAALTILPALILSAKKTFKILKI